MAAILKRKISETEKQETLCENIQGAALELGLSQDGVATLIRTPLSTYKKWLRNEKIPYKPHDPQYEAILNFLRLYFNLDAMFQNAEDAKQWLYSSHEAFHASPFDFACKSMENLITVRKYSDYVRGLGA